MENIPLMITSRRTDLDQYRKDENRTVENFEDGKFQALRPNHDRQTHTHHKVTAIDDPQMIIPELLTGRSLNQNNDLA